MTVKYYVLQGEITHTKNFVSDLRQAVGFLRVQWFPPPIKLDAIEILLKVALTTLTLTPVVEMF
jgi:hypothetical protein